MMQELHPQNLKVEHENDGFQNNLQVSWYFLRVYWILKFMKQHKGQTWKHQQTQTKQQFTIHNF